MTKTKSALKAGSVLRFEDEGGTPGAATSTIAPSPAPPRPRGANIMLVAKIDPAKRIAAIIPIRTDMRTIRKMVGKHVGEQLVTSIGGVEVKVCCETIGTGGIWRVRGSLPVRGRALLYGFAGFGPADFPAKADWLKRMIDFDVDLNRAINDPRKEETDAEAE